MKRRIFAVIEKLLFRQKSHVELGVIAPNVVKDLQQLVEKCAERVIVKPEWLAELVVATPAFFSKRSKIVADPEEEPEDIRQRAKRAWEKRGRRQKNKFSPAELHVNEIKILRQRTSCWKQKTTKDE